MFNQIQRDARIENRFELCSRGAAIPHTGGFLYFSMPFSNPTNYLLVPVRRFVTRKAFGRPAGIVFVWASLIYAGFSFSQKLTFLLDIPHISRLILLEGVATWAILIVSGVALARRRLIARMAGGMAMTLLLFHSIFHDDLFGIALALISLPCLAMNRRWYDERLPKEE